MQYVVHSNDIARLDKVLKLFDLLSHHLQHLHVVADGNELVGAATQTIHLDALDVGEHLVVVCLVVPWYLTVQEEAVGEQEALTLRPSRLK